MQIHLRAQGFGPRHVFKDLRSTRALLKAKLKSKASEAKAARADAAPTRSTPRGAESPTRQRLDAFRLRRLRYMSELDDGSVGLKVWVSPGS